MPDLIKHRSTECYSKEKRDPDMYDGGCRRDSKASGEKELTGTGCSLFGGCLSPGSPFSLQHSLLHNDGPALDTKALVRPQHSLGYVFVGKLQQANAETEGCVHRDSYCIEHVYQNNCTDSQGI